MRYQNKQLSENLYVIVLGWVQNFVKLENLYIMAFFDLLLMLITILLKCTPKPQKIKEK